MTPAERHKYAVYVSAAFVVIFITAVGITLNYCLKISNKDYCVPLNKVISYKSTPSQDWVQNGERQYPVVLEIDEDSYKTIRIEKKSYIKLCGIFDRVKFRKVPKDSVICFSKIKHEQKYKLKLK